MALNIFEKILTNISENHPKSFGLIFTRYTTLASFLGKSTRSSHFFRKLAQDINNPNTVSAFGLMSFGHDGFVVLDQVKSKLEIISNENAGDPFHKVILSVLHSYVPPFGYKRAKSILHNLPESEFSETEKLHEIVNNFIQIRHGHGNNIRIQQLLWTGDIEKTITSLVKKENTAINMKHFLYLLLNLSSYEDLTGFSSIVAKISTQNIVTPRMEAIKVLIMGLNKADTIFKEGAILINDSIKKASPDEIFPSMAKGFSIFYRPTGGIEEASLYFKEYIKSTKDHYKKAISKHHLGMIYTWSGRYEEARQTGFDTTTSCTICFYCPGGCG